MPQHYDYSPLTPPCRCYSFFFFNDTATTEIYTLSLHDALPIWPVRRGELTQPSAVSRAMPLVGCSSTRPSRSEEHTSELQSPCNLVCRLLLEKKKQYRVHVQYLRARVSRLPSVVP